MKYILLIIAGVICTFQAQAQSSPAQVILHDGRIIYAYHLLDTPRHLRFDHCDKYIFSDSMFSSLTDGLYQSSGGEKFLIDKNCLFPATGTAALADDRTAYFFVQDTFNTNGNVMYFCADTMCNPAADGKYALLTGQEFEIEKGVITDYGFFDSGKIQYEDRH